MLVQALLIAPEGGEALDLGAGALNDARFLAEKGYRVTVVDSEPYVATLAKDIPGISTVLISSFEEYGFPTDRFSVVNAQYSLPFLSRDALRAVIASIKDSLIDGGIFAGQFFGLQDEWVKLGRATGIDAEELAALFSEWELTVREEKKTGATISGQEKFWHVFDVIAKKPVST